MKEKQLTIRGVSTELGKRLSEMSRERGESVNSLVLRLLSRAAGLDERRQRLRRYATWSDEDAKEFEAALRAQRVIDENMWK